MQVFNYDSMGHIYGTKMTAAIFIPSAELLILGSSTRGSW